MTAPPTAPTRDVRLWALLLAAWIASSLASIQSPVHAHLAFPEFHSIKTTVTASANEIHLQVVVEIPLADLILAFNQHFAHLDLISEIQKGNIESLETEFRNATFARFAQGLKASVNGDELPKWEPAPDPVNGRAGEGFFIYILETRLATQPRGVSVEFTNELFPAKPLVLANLALAEPNWEGHRSSTPQPPTGTDLTEGTASELELWSDEPEKRRFHVRLEATTEANSRPDLKPRLER